jgi:AbrB family looped-hinge helix DNA binding protein
MNYFSPSSPAHDQEWLRVLDKGLVTIPVQWRSDLGLAAGSIIRAQKTGAKIVLEPTAEKLAPYRVYSDEEIDAFLKADKLPKKFLKKRG